MLKTDFINGISSIVEKYGIVESKIDTTSENGILWASIKVYNIPVSLMSDIVEKGFKSTSVFPYEGYMIIQFMEVDK